MDKNKLFTSKEYGQIYRDPNKVSIIMTNYNCENLIERSILSVLNQTYQNIELLIVDDNSSDSSIRIIQNLAKKDDRIRVFKNTETLGTYWSKNSVINKTSGSFITMIDSDDHDLPYKIEKQVNSFKYGDFVCVTCQNERKVSEFSNETEKIVLGYPSMMFRYEVYDKVGLYDTVRFGGDSEFYDRVLKTYGKNKVYHMNEVLQISPRRTNGLTSIIPEKGLERKNYLKNYQKWHESGEKLYIDFPTKNRPFPINEESKVKYADLSHSIIVESKSTQILPVIMCVWKRTEGLEKIVEQLNGQTLRNFKLFVWNNNKELENEFKRILENANFNYELYTNDKNIGGFGRFFYAKKIRKTQNLIDHCVFIDDDQEFGPELLTTFYNEIKPNRITSQWGWEFNKLEYYGEKNRVKRNPGETIHYAGTGGMVSDMRVFDSEGLFDCPEKYWFVEDLWLSFYANKHLEYELIKSAAVVKNGDDIHSLYRVVLDVKKPMLVDLVNNYGWNILSKKESTEIKLSNDVKIIEPKIEIIPQKEIQLTKKEINYDKINSIFNNNNPKTITKPQIPQNSNNIKLNSETFAKIQRTKKRLR